MRVEDFVKELNSDFFVGVPDSQLKVLCNYLMAEKGINDSHIIAANEGNCVGIAAGHYLATGEVSVVYMQNSGLGNIVNPTASLLHTDVYGIPCIFVVGWRGEPGVHDEPQHVYQGKITEQLLKDLDIESFIISKDTEVSKIHEVMEHFSELLAEGKSVAFIIRKGALEGDIAVKYADEYSLVRENVIEEIVKVAGEDIIVSTTGKASRELFELREKYGQGHEKDFLTVGSMGHSSSIALGVAFSKPESKVWCIDGDGAVLMHMGSMAVLGAKKPNNVVHIVINNEAHETVGGMPTVAGQVDLRAVALACGYSMAVTVSTEEELKNALNQAKEAGQLTFVEVKCNIQSRKDLGRPTTTAKENKENFMKYLKCCK